MPLRDDLLTPIPGANPSGESLRYAPVYDKIKEARREEDDAPQGDWKRERKTADFNQVLKLAGDSLAAKSKDLQLAAWMTEALLKKEGFSGLHAGLGLLHSLLEGFWDTVYPENEDGDLELRAAPLEWVGTKLVEPLKKTPFTKGGYGFFKFKESRAVGYEEEAAASETKRESRVTAIEEGKITAEEFDTSFQATKTADYEKWVADLDGSLRLTETLNDFCNEKFGDVAPSFNPLREAIEEVRHTVNSLLQKKLEAEGRVAAPEPEPEAVEDSSGDSDAGVASAPPRAAAKKKVSGLDPADVDEVALRLAAVAKFLRQNDSQSPAPYMLLRGYRWGEVRANGDSPDPLTMLPPTTEVRQQLKRMSMEGDWSGLLEVAETAMAEPCGRAWLDLQRYVVTACENTGYSAVGATIRSELKALLGDIPRLHEMTLMDDTPTANAETQTWLKEFAFTPVASSNGNSSEQSESSYQEQPRHGSPHDGSTASEAREPDVYDLATQALRAGRQKEAFEMIANDIPRQQSGRDRFQRKLQLAQLFMMTGHETMAQPILEDLAGEIDRHQLEDWEPANMVSHPLAMLYRCVSKLRSDDNEKQRLYARICRLDPMQALSFTK